LRQGGFVEVLFRSGWRLLPFDLDQFEELYDLRMVLRTTARWSLLLTTPKWHVCTVT
jgi:DNA-binding GntR family transcriptional regulator